MNYSGYDHWLESGPGGPYDDADEVECEACDRGRVVCCHDDGCGECGGTGDHECRTCNGTCLVAAHDDEREDDLSDAEADADALEGAGFGSEGW